MKPAKKYQRRNYAILQALRARRIATRVRQDVLAEQIGYHWVTLSRWERGETMPSFQALHDWATALGLTIQLSAAKAF